MVARLAAVVALVAAVLPCLAQDTKPAAADLLKGLEPYDSGAERNLFFAAAGVDSELDFKEYEANVGKAGGLIRPFEKWEAMLPFEKNGNKSLDWSEFDNYRKDLRDRIVGMYDLDKDGKLSDKERAAANADLAKGLVPAAAAGAATTRSYYSGAGYAEMVKKYDKDGDGKLSSEESAAMSKAIMQERNRQLIEKYDANSDGKLDDDEMAKVRADQLRDMKDAMHRHELAVYDLNKDGEITDEERKSVQDKWRKDAEDRQAKWELEIFDADGDGKLSEQEAADLEKYREACKKGVEALGDFTRTWEGFFDDGGTGKLSDDARKAKGEWGRQDVARQQAETLKKYDEDGDGKLSKDEQSRMIADQMAAGRKTQDEMIRKFDLNGDGKLDRRESMLMGTEAMGKAVSDYRSGLIERLIKAFDTDGDGKLSADEKKAMVKKLADEAREREKKEPAVPAGAY